MNYSAPSASTLFKLCARTVYVQKFIFKPFNNSLLSFSFHSEFRVLKFCIPAAGYRQPEVICYNVD
jgi:hypothetical protein